MTHSVTLDDIKAKCLECGDCWEWQGIVSKSNVPKINIHVGYGKNGRTVLSARRVTWELTHRAIPKGMLVTVKCGNPKCLNPDHLKLTNRAQVATIVGARLEVKLKKSAKYQLHLAKLDLEKVRAIRLGDRPDAEWAQEFGVSKSAIAKVRLGKSWKERGNPFAGLGA